MQLIGGGAAAGTTPSAAGGSAFIKDTRLESFAKDVIEASMRVPVLVDFWAPWCGPCKQLQPILEKLVNQANGKILLCKVNIDEEPEIAQQLRIQSVPTVYAFVSGQPVTGFAGAQPESQVKALIDKLIGAPLGPEGATDLEAANAAAEAGDDATAAQIYSELLQEDPANAEALGRLARLLIASGQVEDAKALLDGAPAEAAGHAEVTGARAALDLAQASGDLGDPAELEARLAADQDDHDARLRLAVLLFLRGQVEAALSETCKVVKRDRTFEEDRARRQMVQFFDALGPKDPMTLKGRRMLSTVLFS